MRQDMGKVKLARIATNIPEYTKNTWGYKSFRHYCTESLLNSISNATSQCHSKTKKCIWMNTFWITLHNMTLKQWTQSWFLAHKFYFIRTTFHVVVNVSSTVSFNFPEVCSLHEKFNSNNQPNPSITITTENASNTNDLDILLQRIAHRRVGNSTESERARVTETAAAFCVSDEKTLVAVKDLCRDHAVQLQQSQTYTWQQLAEALSEKFPILLSMAKTITKSLRPGMKLHKKYSSIILFFIGSWVYWG